MSPTGGVETDAFRELARRRHFYDVRGMAYPVRLLDLEWWAVDVTKRANTRPVLSVFRSLLEEQKRDVIKKLPEALTAIGVLSQMPYSTTKRGVDIIADIFDLESWNDILERVLSGPITDTLARGWSTAFARIGTSDPGFVATGDLFETTLTQIVNKSKFVNATTSNQLVRMISDKTLTGVDTGDIIAAASKLFDTASAGRALTAARTATNGAFEGGQQGAYVEAGVPNKLWLSVRDDRVRDAEFNHVAADGQVVPVGEPYMVSGEPLMFPVDPAGSAGNVINCRCVSLPQA